MRAINPDRTLQRARLYLSKVPGAISGQGGHNQTFAAACALVHGFALSDGDALTLLREWNRNCQPPWTDRELAHKVRSAATARHEKPRGHLLGTHGSDYPPRRMTPMGVKPRQHIDPATAVENYLKGFRCDEADIRAKSPIKPAGDWTQDGICLVSHLYRPGEHINFVTEYTTEEKDGEIKANPAGNGATVERDRLIAHWRHRGMPKSKAGGWIRMNPLDGKGICDSNVAAFRFALLEWDKMPLDLQLSFLGRVPLPIAAILTSGGRSVHAWIHINAPDRETYRGLVERMIDLLSRVGIDNKNKNPSRLSRLPGVAREIGAHENGRQRVLYLNPEPADEGRIFDA